ncbi:helix-turn-helix domain-containing protein [Erythrobacter sp. THAF29]|uniref:MerR family transcriptional regulator n=1 Tax=Erythrobacter sp. THAF29 TaxID=2587851 RepID=UPI0012690354|nr:helix-turn-helix domain-containing protein [Erythrobacter sp. THAF29]QFT76817.1 HTH-type transcriptional regulator HmrR [Erythrobacter sp. THAF29]
MKIGEVSKRSGCNIETIRYYERIGVIAPPPRKGTYRDYGPEDVERLRFVRRARELGFSLEEVQALLDLAPHPNANCEQVQAIAEQHLANVRKKLADLKKMEAALAVLVSRCGERSEDRCPVVESLAAGA